MSITTQLVEYSWIYVSVCPYISCVAVCHSPKPRTTSKTACRSKVKALDASSFVARRQPAHRGFRYSFLIHSCLLYNQQIAIAKDSVGFKNKTDAYLAKYRRCVLLRHGATLCSLPTKRTPNHEHLTRVALPMRIQIEFWHFPSPIF